MSRSRNYVFTWNNPPVCPQFPPHKYIIYGKEVGDSGTPHLQGFIIFKSACTLSAAIKKLPSPCHVEVAVTVDEAITYCKKDGDVYEDGEAPISKSEQGELGKAAYDDAFRAARENRLDDIPTKLRLRYFATFDKIAAQNQSVIVPLEKLDNWWFYGDSGAGKSSAARKLYPDAYVKRQNTKWWDGYNGQSVVIIDDVSPFTKSIADDMKVYSDHYAFWCEIKGTCKYIRPITIVVTSQYTIEEIWEDCKTRQAMNRRFQVRMFA